LNWQAVGAIGEAIGAIAVVATLLYLARQVRHARREQQIAAIRANRNERREYYLAARDSPYLPALLIKLKTGGDLSPEEKQRLTFHFSAAWGLLYSEWIHRQLDLPGEYATSDQLNVANILSLPGGAEWFEDFGERLYPGSFVAHVQHIREALDTPSSDLPT